MRDPSPSTDRRYVLRTLGTLTLHGPDGETLLGQHGHHRRRLALLAVLAAAGDRGWSRDQLLLFFWPEATQSRARHSLEQLLYALRSSIGESLFAGSNPVQLNPEVVKSDVGAFAAALERSDFEAAVEEYRGPFLDGFYLGDAPEFERWVEGERARLSGGFTDALHRLAQRAESVQDHVTAVRWWRRLVETDPVSSRNATGLIRSLMNAGDHAAALQYAERHETVVKEELGTNVSPSVAGLVAEVRAETHTGTLAGTPVKASLTPRRPVDPVAAGGTLIDPSRQKRSLKRRQAFAVGAVLVALVTIATVSWFGGAMRDRNPAAAAEPSIAVLPFANLSGDPRDAALVDGLSDELITALSRIRGLRVVARQSAFLFRNSNIDVRRIGDSLNVANILEGSVQRNAGTLRIRVRLVDAPNGVTRWSTTFDRELEDIFAVQSEIATSVAGELNLRLVAGAAQRIGRGSTRDFGAYELYLRGRDPVRMRTDSGPLFGLALLQQAVALDSGFAAAYASMPSMYFGLAGRSKDVSSLREYQRLALAASQKALALDPNLPEAHTGLGIALALGLVDLHGSESALRRSLELGGSPRAREHLARVLMWTGRHAEALTEAKRAAEEDPLSPSAAADVGEALCVNRRYDEGLAQLSRVASLRVPLQRVPAFKGVCYAMQGKWSEALAELREPDGGDPYSPLHGFFVARSGDLTRAKELDAKAVARWRKTGRGAANVAYIAVGLGNLDRAFEWLERSSDDLVAMTSLMYPFFTELRADPRFDAYRQRFGLQKR